MTADPHLEEHRPLFFEVLDFLRSCGGAYDTIKGYQAFRIWECLSKGLYLCQRDTNGQIVRFVSYWRLDESELPKAQRFLRPADPTKGTVIFTVDFASKLPTVGKLHLFQSHFALKEPGATLLCCEHKGRFVVCEKTRVETRPWKLRR